MRGFISKKESLCEVLKIVEPDVCILNETGLKGKNKVSLPGYLTFTKNREVKSMGGISTSIKEEWKNFAVNVGQGEGEDEFLITRLDNFKPAICVINYYGEQESRVGKDEVEARWVRLKLELDRIKSRGEGCLLVGDMNKHIGCDDLGVSGNIDKISTGGKLIRELLASEEYFLANGLAEAVGGPFTRVDPANEENKSCLDLFIGSSNLRPYLKKLIIDSKREHAIRRVGYKNGRVQTTYTDHYTIILYMENIPCFGVSKEKVIRWNLSKEGGWEAYKEITDDKSQEIIRIVEDKNKSIEDIFKDFERVDKDIKFEAFGKVTIKDKRKVEGKKSWKEMGARELLEKQHAKAEEELIKLRASGQGRTGSVFKIARSIQGPKNGGMEAHAIADPATGEVVVSADEIKRVSLKYCKDVLTKNVPVLEVKKEVELKERLHRERMDNLLDGGFNPSLDKFNKVVDKYKRGKKRTYDFLVKAGDKFKEAVFQLCRRMLLEEEFPRAFDYTTLNQIFKGKGRREVLSNNRYIHGKDWLPRITEGMVVEEMKVKILDSSSPYQIGGQPGHQPQEHIFTIKSIIAKYLFLGRLIMLQAFDISKFFDKEVLEDVMNTLHEIGIDGKAYRTFYKLNKNTNIRVRTGVGYSERSDEGPMIGQGTGGGALVSQANLDRGITEMFASSGDEVGYGAVKIQPLMFQDDIMRAVGSVEAARAGCIKVNSVMNSKQLELNKDKTSFIIYGRKDDVARVRKEVENSPIMCGSFATKERIMDKWSGDMLHQDGLAASVKATVED